jgi:hypothetical protein
MTTKAENLAKPAPKPAQPLAPSSAPTAPPATALSAAPGPVRVQATLLAPVAEDAELVAQFKRYVELKDKLLEDTDYIWSVRWQIGDQEDSKFFKRRAQAEAWAEGLRRKGIEPELEKKIKKSGCMKLGKAFGISDWPVEEMLDRTAGIAYYKVRAEAPNGQYKERTGTCDRTEKGKAKASFDTIMATALTRAADRAIMALLGGETTAEEFEEVVDEGDKDTTQPPAPAPIAKPTPAPPDCAGGTCQRCGASWSPAAPGVTLCPPCVECPTCFICGEQVPPMQTGSTTPPPKFCSQHKDITPEEQERLVKLNETFAGRKPAKTETERGQYNRRLWAAAHAAYGKERAEEVIHKAILKKYQRSSLTELSDEQFKELTVAMEEYAKKKGGK